MKIEIVKKFSFDAAHFLPYHEGKCQNTHGHTYLLEVGFRDEPGSTTGMVEDFGDIKKFVKEKIVDLLDHSLLNNVTCQDYPYYFPSLSPTAEAMVEWMVERIKGAQLDSPKTSPKAELSYIRLYETPDSYAEWRAG